MNKLGVNDWRALCRQDYWVHIAKAADPYVSSLHGGKEYYFLNLSKFVWEPGFTLGTMMHDANHWMTQVFCVDGPGAANLTTIEYQQGSGPVFISIFAVLRRYNEHLKPPDDAPAQPGITSSNEFKLRL